MGASALLCRALALALALAGLCAARSHAAPAPKPLGCLIEPDRVADVGSQVLGVVERLDVERGDEVKAGQPLLTLRADLERAHVSAADTRARIDADVLAAKASLALAAQKVSRAEALVAQNFVSDQAVEQARGEAELARQKHNQVLGQQRVYAEEQRIARAQLALRTVRSPFAGVVTERYINPGERVEDRAVMRVAVIDPLRVELMVPTAHYGALQLGDRLTIHPELPGVGAVVATVRHIDRVLDAASNSFRVRLTLPNPDHRLPAGLRCKADLPFVAAAASVSVPPGKGAPGAERRSVPPPRAPL